MMGRLALATIGYLVLCAIPFLATSLIALIRMDETIIVRVGIAALALWPFFAAAALCGIFEPS